MTERVVTAAAAGEKLAALLGADGGYLGGDDWDAFVVAAPGPRLTVHDVHESRSGRLAPGRAIGTVSDPAVFTSFAALSDAVAEVVTGLRRRTGR